MVKKEYSLCPLAEDIEKQPGTQKLLGLFQIQAPSMIYGISGAQKSMLTAMAVSREKCPAVVILPTEKDILKWTQDISYFAPDIPVLTFPIVETAGFKVAFTGTERLRERMHCLSSLLSGRPCIALMTAAEASQKIPSPDHLRGISFLLARGKTLNRDQMLTWLTAGGYERTDQVERCGHFAVRGDIIDIFAVNEEHPLRIEFWDDQIESICFFDENTQRSIQEKEELAVLPIQIKEGEKTVLDYADEGILIYEEPSRAESELKTYLREEHKQRSHCVEWTSLIHNGSPRARVFLSVLNQHIDGIAIQEQRTWPNQAMMNYQRQMPLFLADLKHLIQSEWTVSVVCAKNSEKEELQISFRENGIPCSQERNPGEVFLCDGLLSEGFELTEMKKAVITAGDIFGQKKLLRYRKASRGQQIRYFSDLHQGDYVVQKIHGIGRYIGMNTIEVDGIHRDYLTIQYAGSDKLYLPMDQITTLEKYIGPEGKAPSLQKMGGIQWERVRRKAKASIRNLAEKLIAVYAKREITQGYAFPADTPWQREFEEAFPYVETPDQVSAIDAIKEAMEKSQPMDMLLCGDVGFGKTEVAMRAVFKCIMSGKQAVVLVPTTVLSQQHYKTFTARMGPFGITVGVLNRFCSSGERKRLLQQLSDGQMDVIIGTHAVISGKIKCRDLGLLVVDEEQRFGVMQKEKWKSWSAGVDVLTLSATPIPRTLHMCLAGVRDMAVINTPPSNRHAIQTYVAEYDDSVVKEAVMREKERGGQIYFVYNRIDSIGAMAEHLRNILPNTISIGVAYGRMDGTSLEKVMYDFYQGTYDVLLCTTLIENGLDQPNANTMIVYDADRLGLSQIYQMRGRVGRSDKIARAYFFYRRGKVLSEVAEKRLEAIREFTELGSGFKIAMRDLEIRGAGNLLGSEQHGNMASVGFAAYCTMLEEAMQQLKAEKEGKPIPKRMPDTVIEFARDAYINPEYIQGEEQKIEVYRRLAMTRNEKDLQYLTEEVEDRFGPMTEPVKKLFQIAMLRIKARKLGIGSVSDEGRSFLLTWADTKPMKNWNFHTMPKNIIEKLHFLPTEPMRVRIGKASLGRDETGFLMDLLDEIHREIAKGGNCA
jgi:transcription-repair coupling factor (superfamily II helicase)